MKQKINITSILLSYFIFQGSFLFGQDNFVKLNPNSALKNAESNK